MILTDRHRIDRTEQFKQIAHINEGAAHHGEIVDNCQLIALGIDRALREGEIACALQIPYFFDHHGPGFEKYLNQYLAGLKGKTPEIQSYTDHPLEFLLSLAKGDSDDAKTADILATYEGYVGMVRTRWMTLQGPQFCHVSNFLIQGGRLMVIDAQTIDRKVYELLPDLWDDLSINMCDLHVTGPLKWEYAQP